MKDVAVEFPDDIARLVRIMASAGVTIDQDLAIQIWESHSESQCAGWLTLPDDDNEIIQTFNYWLEQQ